MPSSRRPYPVRRAALALVALGGGLLVVVVANAARVALWRAPVASPAAEAAGAEPRALLAVHMHTTASDGKGTLDDVVGAAAEAGLDAIVVTDHDGFAHKAHEGRRGRVLVLVGSELSTDDGHVVALGLGEPPVPFSFETAGAIDDVHAAGGLAIAAHPTRRIGKGIRWAGALDRVDGIEVANLDSAWRERVRPLAWLTAAALYPAAPARAVALSAAREAAALRLLDGELARRPVLAIGGSDAHGSPRGYGGLFAAMANVLLLDRPLGEGLEADTRAVLAALRARHVLVAWRALGDPRRAAFRATRGAERYRAGDVAPAGGPLDLVLETGLDRDADLRIVHGGQVVARGRGRSLAFRAAKAGAYRGEVWVDGPFDVPWLLANAIGLAGDGWPAAPLESAAALIPMAGRSAAGVDLLPSLVPESDRRSAVQVERGGGAGGLVAGFRLGVEDRPGDGVWCALVDRSPRVVTATSALVLTGAASTRMRLEVSFRLPGREGERFRRSVELAPGPRRYRLPLTTFRSATRARRALPEIESLDAVILMVSGETARPGSRAVLWIRELGLE